MHPVINIHLANAIIADRRRQADASRIRTLSGSEERASRKGPRGRSAAV